MAGSFLLLRRTSRPQGLSLVELTLALVLLTAMLVSLANAVSISVSTLVILALTDDSMVSIDVRRESTLVTCALTVDAIPQRVNCRSSKRCQTRQTPFAYFAAGCSVEMEYDLSELPQPV